MCCLNDDSVVSEGLCYWCLIYYLLCRLLLLTVVNGMVLEVLDTWMYCVKETVGHCRSLYISKLVGQIGKLVEATHILFILLSQRLGCGYYVGWVLGLDVVLSVVVVGLVTQFGKCSY